MSSMDETWEYIRTRFCGFLENFEHGQRHYYLDHLEQMHQEEVSTMYVNFEHLNAFDTDLADLLLVRLQYTSVSTHLWSTWC